MQLWWYQYRPRAHDWHSALAHPRLLSRHRPARPRDDGHASRVRQALRPPGCGCSSTPDCRAIGGYLWGRPLPPGPGSLLPPAEGRADAASPARTGCVGQRSARDQSATRGAVEIVEQHMLEDGRTIVKVSQLACWTRERAWHYITNHHLPSPTTHLWTRAIRASDAGLARGRLQPTLVSGLGALGRLRATHLLL